MLWLEYETVCSTRNPNLEVLGDGGTDHIGFPERKGLADEAGPFQFRLPRQAMTLSNMCEQGVRGLAAYCGGIPSTAIIWKLAYFLPISLAF